MDALQRGFLNRSHGVGFLFGLIVSMLFTMCSESDAESVSTVTLDGLEERIAALETKAADVEPRLATVEAASAAVEPRLATVEAAAAANIVLWERKTISSPITVSTPSISALMFTGLEGGKTYRLSMSAQLEAGAGTAELDALHCATPIAGIKTQSRDASGEIEIQGTQVIFTAACTVLEFEYAESGSGGYLYPGFTYAILEELPVHSVTTKW